MYTELVQAERLKDLIKGFRRKLLFRRHILGWHSVELGSRIERCLAEPPLRFAGASQATLHFKYIRRGPLRMSLRSRPAVRVSARMRMPGFDARRNTQTKTGTGSQVGFMLTLREPTATDDETIAGVKLGVSILDRIGNTPMVRLERLTAHLPGVQLLGKAEWTNPGGSVKDRAARAIVLDAIERGELRPGSRAESRRLLDATSGNTGIAYAMLGAALGFPVTLVMPTNVSPERKRILSAYGAQILWTDPADGTDGSIRKARELAAHQADKYWYADQYSNDNNWRAHYLTTANEIWEQTEGRVTHFLAGLGTSGTFVGTTRRLKELNPRIQCISMEPDSPFNGLEGLKHMETALVPRIYDASLADRKMEMGTETAHSMARRLPREEGLLVGVSAAAAVASALEIAEECAARGEQAVIVTILCDSAEKYLSERFWEEEG